VRGAPAGRRAEGKRLFATTSFQSHSVALLHMMEESLAVLEIAALRGLYPSWSCCS
jgi:hypothetical protein